MTVVRGVATFECRPLIGYLAKTHTVVQPGFFFFLIEVKSKFYKKLKDNVVC